MVHISSKAVDFIGAPEEIRTPDPQIRSLWFLPFLMNSDDGVS
jgi:hypothetical protein